MKTVVTTDVSDYEKVKQLNKLYNMPFPVLGFFTRLTPGGATVFDKKRVELKAILPFLGVA